MGDEALTNSIDDTNTRLVEPGAVANALAHALGETRAAEDICKEMINDRLDGLTCLLRVSFAFRGCLCRGAAHSSRWVHPENGTTPNP